MRALAGIWIALACGCGQALAQTQTLRQLEQQLQADPTSLKAKEALAEAYLRECELEKSLVLWQGILRQVPDHGRARRVVDRLTAQALDLDSHLEVLTALIERGITEGTAALLDAAGQRAATDSQKARILYLRGLLSLRTSERARGRASFAAAMRLHPDTAWAGRSAIALAEVERQAGTTDEARRLLRGVIANEKLADPAVKQTARLRLVLIETHPATPQEKIAALRELLKDLPAAEVRREALEEIVRVVTAAEGGAVPEAIDATAEILKTDPPQDRVAAILRRLEEVARTSQDPTTLDRVLALLEDARLPAADLVREAAFIRVEALLSRAVVENDAAAMQGFVAAAGEALAKLPEGGDRGRIRRLRGRALLVRAQKLLALSGAGPALPSLLEAKDHYLTALAASPKECFARLETIGRLLEHAGQWETASALYREVSTRFPHTPQGRDALLKVARLYERRLNAPLAALEAYAEYAARYPAELPYRQLRIGRRLRRLGYANLLDFQKRTGLSPDGIYGPKTRRKLEELERSFGMIRLSDGAGAGILRGAFVHPAIFRIAREMELAGRHHQAITAYRLFLNLFPTKKQADDALIAIARSFRENLLFEEALGAYRQLMEDFPKGDVTSEAYVESAGCLENLGRWSEAKEFYELYLRKFPKYKHVKLCRQRLALLEEVQQYADFIASNPASAKLAEAQYQLGTILYKRMKSHTKAAVEFVKIARRHPGHVRAAEGLFTAGVAQLRAENFPAARKVFAELVRRYPQNRLADDGQFWIGHTYEYSARALGKLDERRIVLRRRSLAARARLLADLELRRQYHPGARGGPELPEEIWGADTLGVLTSGSRRDRVNADLFRAIGAYRQVVEKFKTGDMAGNALLRIGTIYTKYLKDPEKGIRAYQELLAHYPASKEAVDALQEVGSYLLKNKKYDEAIKSFQQFIYNYPRHSRVQEAMLAIARCHAEKKAWDKALDAYQRYLNKFPRGRFADFAKAQIEWIRMYYF